VKVLKQLRIFIALLCALTLALPPAEAKTKKGDRLYKDGLKAEDVKNYDLALNLLDRALQEDPKDPGYMLADQRVRHKAADAHVTAGKKLQQTQQLDEALLEFQKAFIADPSSQIALQKVRETAQMIEERKKAAAGTPILTPAEQARLDLQKRIDALQGPPQLKPLNNQISSLKMNNQPARVLYESVGKLVGINVLFDPQGIDTLGATGRNFNLDLTNVTVDEALNYVSLVTHTFWKPVSRNAIFVTQESEPKRQEYQDEVVKVFYIQNATSQNEFNEIFNGVRTGAKLTIGIFAVPGQNAIVIRGATDSVALAEKLIHDLDRPKPEVVIDVLVMEVSKSQITNLGAAVAGLTNGLNVPIQFTGTQSANNNNNNNNNNNSSNTTNSNSTNSNSTSSTTSSSLSGLTSGSNTSQPGTIPLSRVAKLSTNDWNISLPGGLIQALLTDSSTRLLQRPEIRVSDGGKGQLKIGSKIPYVSGSLSSAVAAAGTVPYATTQFQQVDVGVNVDLQPHVNGAEDVSMKVKVEVSNVVSTETIAGVQQPIIGQKVNETEIRMKDGEVSLLGGLTSETDTRSISGIPGVANMPVLGYLFGNRSRDKENDDIVIALIPHIVRAPDLSAAGGTGVYAGSERFVRVQRNAEGGTANQPQQPPQAQAPVVAPPVPLNPAPSPAPGQQPQTPTPDQQPVPAPSTLPQPRTQAPGTPPQQPPRP
jgi:general secretion pathway protein D